MIFGAAKKFGPDRAFFFLWRHAVLPTDLLQVDPHFDS